MSKLSPVAELVTSVPSLVKVAAITALVVGFVLGLIAGVLLS